MKGARLLSRATAICLHRGPDLSADPTNFIGVNLATFSRLSAVELLTWHFSFEISKERERDVYVCVRGREEREVFFSRASMRIIHGVRGWEITEVKN